jgi:hypothetical protein
MVAGILPDRGSRLCRIEEIIVPRLQQLEGVADGISPKNVELVFSVTIAETIRKLDTMIWARFPKD